MYIYFIVCERNYLALNQIFTFTKLEFFFEIIKKYKNRISFIDDGCVLIYSIV